MKYTWEVEQTAEATIADDVPVSPFDRPIEVQTKAHLGFGLLRPFRRDEKNDFANAGGEALVRACVGQVLGTRAASEISQGELPWRTEFGSLLHHLRHHNNNHVLVELAKVYVADALRRWEPRVLLKRVDVIKEEVVSGEGETAVSIRLRYDIIKTNVPGNQVLVRDVEHTVSVGN